MTTATHHHPHHTYVAIAHARPDQPKTTPPRHRAARDRPCNSLPMAPGIDGNEISGRAPKNRPDVRNGSDLRRACLA